MNCIVPAPNKMQSKNGNFVIDGEITIKSSARYSAIAEKLANMIRTSYTCVKITENSSKLIELREVTDLGQEEYVIDCSEKEIIVKAGKPAGLIYAIATLYQLLKLYDFHPLATPIKCFHITDKPRFRWRGIMLDEARHFFGKDTVLQLLDIMALNKLNVLHWHLSDDQGYRLESKAFPLLHEISSKRNDTQIGDEHSDLYEGTGHGGYYTHEDIAQIVDHAKKLNIEIVPHIELPAHTTAIAAAYPQFFCNTECVPVATSFGKKDTLLCVGDTAVYDFVFTLIDEICSLFPSPYIGIGGKDVDTSILANNPKCVQYMAENDIQNADELLIRFLNDLSEKLKSKGRRMISNNTAISDGVSCDTIGYYQASKTDNTITFQLGIGRNYIISRPQYMSFDLPYCIIPLKKTYDYDPDKDIEDCRYLRGKIMGMEACLWTEWISDKEKFDLCLYPRMGALSETCWSEPHRKSFKSFKSRLPEYVKMLSERSVGCASNDISMPKLIEKYKRMYYYGLKDKNMEVRLNRGHDDNN